MGRSTSILTLAAALLCATVASGDPRGPQPATPARTTLRALSPSIEAPRALPEVSPPEEIPSATVVFAGDLVPHADVLDAVSEFGPASLLAPIAPVLRAADLALVNLETPVADSRPPSREQMRFNVHASFLEALTEAGVDAVSSANNHVFDQGVGGVDETVRALRARNVTPVGAALAGEDPLTPAEFPLAGSTLCVLAATRLLNFDMTLPDATHARVALARPEVPAEENAFIAAVRAAHERCGAVLVSLHAGSEYEERVEPRERAFFLRVAEAGADAVIGHHPHVPLRAEWLSVSGRRVPVFYSLGNLVSNQGANAEAALFEDLSHPHVSLDPRTRAGLIASMRFERHGARLSLASAGYLPLWTRNAHRPSPDAPAPRVSAGLMPRLGGGDRGMARVWARTLRDADPAMLLDAEAVPGALVAHVEGDDAARGRPRNEGLRRGRTARRRLAVHRELRGEGRARRHVFR